MRPTPLVATLLALALSWGLGAAPAAAGGLPPLDLARGQGSIGIGALSLGGDVALADGLSVGLLAYNSLLYTNIVAARGTWTQGKTPFGTLGYMATGGLGLTAGAYAGTRNAPFLVAGPVIEASGGWFKLRLALQGGLLIEPRPLYDTGDVPFWGGDLAGAPVVLGTWTHYQLAVLPGVEVAFPLGSHVELTLFGSNLAGIHGRW